jgi:hypothetical protein
MEKTIHWEKWVDPLGLNINDVDPEFVERNQENEKPDFLQNEEEYHFNQIPKAQYPRKMLLSPMGVLPVTPWNNPGRVFNFWVGHTNFSIGKTSARKINSCPGVEIADIWTRYRFRISVAKCFTFPEVADRIHKLFDIYPKGKRPNIQFPAELQKQIETITTELGKTYKHWVLFIDPSGHPEHWGSETCGEDFKNVLEIYNRAKDITGGVILTSEKENNG